MRFFLPQIKKYDVLRKARVLNLQKFSVAFLFFPSTLQYIKNTVRYTAAYLNLEVY